MIDLTGHFGYLLIGLGMWQLANRRNGFALRFLGEAIWIAIGLMLGLTSIWIWGIIFATNDLYGFIRWEREHWRWLG